MENPANLHQNLFQTVLFGQKLMEFNRGVHQRKVLSHQSFQYIKWREETIRNSAPVWLSVREPMIGFRKKKSNFRTKDANGENGFFQDEILFFEKYTPPKRRAKKPLKHCGKDHPKDLIRGQKAHFQGRSCRFREASSKMTRTLKSKKISYYYIISWKFTLNPEPQKYKRYKR